MTWEDMQAATAMHMADPQPGDRFHEMYSFWVHVIARLDPQIIVEEYIGGRAPTTRCFADLAAFQHAYVYNSISGYWICWADRKAPVSAPP